MANVARLLNSASASALVVAVLFFHFSSANAQGLRIKIDGRPDSQLIAELKGAIPILQSVPVESIRLAKMNKLLFLRIVSDTYCTRGACLNILAVRETSNTRHIVVAATDTIFISDESFQFAGLPSFVASFLTEVPGVVIKVLINDQVIAVIP